jgi:hypothetical protein
MVRQVGVMVIGKPTRFLVELQEINFFNGLIGVVDFPEIFIGCQLTPILRVNFFRGFPVYNAPFALDSGEVNRASQTQCLIVK